MKKFITLFVLVLNVCFCIKPVLAQCPGSQILNDGPYSSGETLMGQSINNACAFSMAGLSVETAITTTGTITLKVYSGNNSCSGGSLLKSGSAT
jgi:hypothetical protein